MRRVSFPYEERKSKLLGNIKRPYAKISLWSGALNEWLDYVMLVDTGADYSLVPKIVAGDLGIDIKHDCEEHESKGVGGKERVYILKKKIQLRIGDMEQSIILGILERDDLPPLLGRTACLDNFDVLFSKHVTYLDDSGVLLNLG
jgi:hypothetical protein